MGTVWPARLLIGRNYNDPVSGTSRSVWLSVPKGADDAKRMLSALTAPDSRARAVRGVSLDLIVSVSQWRRPYSKHREMRADRIGDIARGKVRIMFFSHTCVGVAELLGHVSDRHPAHCERRAVGVT